MILGIIAMLYCLLLLLCYFSSTMIVVICSQPLNPLIVIEVFLVCLLILFVCLMVSEAQVCQEYTPKIQLFSYVPGAVD